MVNMKLVLLIAAIYSVESLIPMLDDDQFNGLLYDTILDAGSPCVRRPYAYKAWQEDEDGKACWDWVHVTSCWGKCDSNEVLYYSFPFFFFF